MGRKRKPSVIIGTSKNEFQPETVDGLPSFVSFIDLKYDKDIGESHSYPIRAFFKSPTEEEKADTCDLYESTNKKLKVINAQMPYNVIKNVSVPLFDYIMTLGFNECFSQDVCRLLLLKYTNTNRSEITFTSSIQSVKEFVSYLSNIVKNLNEFSITAITLDHWVGFAGILENDSRSTNQFIFNKARDPFLTYKPTSFNGRLSQVKCKPKSSIEPAPEHTSEFFTDNSYTDAELYQLIALFTSFISRHTEARKHYEEITEDKMCIDWISPEKMKLMRESGIKEKKQLSNIFEKWFSDKKYDDLLIDHALMWNKQTTETFSSKLQHIVNDKTRKTMLPAFIKRMSKRFGYLIRDSYTFVDFYSDNRNVTFDHQHGYCLVNLFILFTGANRDVVLTIPSRTDDGKSILQRKQTLYINNNNMECELFGFKTRQGKRLGKYFFHIPISAPIYKLLKDYENHIKKNFDGPFFEFSQCFKRKWPRAGLLTKRTKTLVDLYPFFNANGEYHTKIDTGRFRKVFASATMLKKISQISNQNELVNDLKASLKHKNFDTTFSHYLMKTDQGRGIIDAAIVAITTAKIEEGIAFRGKIITHSEAINSKKKVFLCECEDPFNPSHDVAIADECKHYDLCLGCERCIITQKHLPIICARIIQYEDAQKQNWYSWSMMYEDRWMIAYDALKQYAIKDKKNGKQLVESAWKIARRGEVMLPPIITGGI